MYINNIFIPVFDDYPDSLTPELWAQESLMRLENSLIMANLVHRDFEPIVSSFGDIVNTRRPGDLTASRKIASESVTDQTPTSTNVAVPLDQHAYCTFIIKDQDESRAFNDLVTEYLEPAIHALGNHVDRSLSTQLYQFVWNRDNEYNVSGAIGTAATNSSIISVREKMSKANVPLMGRNLVVPPSVDADLLGVDTNVEADKVGDDGSALREGFLGRKYGIQIFMSNNMPSFTCDSTLKTVTSLDGTYAKGATTIGVDAIGEIVAGSWLNIAGLPYLVTAAASAGSIDIAPALQAAGTDATVVHAMDVGAVAGTVTGDDYHSNITVDGFGVAPSILQGVSTGVTAATMTPYGIISTPSATSLYFDRPLDADLADDDVLALMPDGDWCFAFHRNALALVSRPLATVREGTGARSFVVNYNGLSLRVTIAYDSTKQGHRVTVDMLYGVKVLDKNLGTILVA